MAHHLPDNALSILSCPHCGGLPLQYHRDGALLCSVCCAVYPQRNGIFDLRPPDHDQSGEYQGDPPEAARLRNRWDSTRLQHKPGVQAAIEEVARRTFPGCRVLDVGCGTGHIDRWIIERAAPGTRLWAFDVSEAMCRFAQQNCERFGQVTVIRAASRSPMPLRGGSFDVVFERLATIDVALAYEFLRPGVVHPERPWRCQLAGGGRGLRRSVHRLPKRSERAQRAPDPVWLCRSRVSQLALH